MTLDEFARGILTPEEYAFTCALVVIEAARRLDRLHSPGCWTWRGGGCSCGRIELDAALAAYDAAEVEK